MYNMYNSDYSFPEGFFDSLDDVTIQHIEYLADECTNYKRCGETEKALSYLGQYCDIIVENLKIFNDQKHKKTKPKRRPDLKLIRGGRR